jgi:hypothetical protein
VALELGKKVATKIIQKVKAMARILSN